MNNLAFPSAADLHTAHGLILPFVQRTPVLGSTAIDALAGCRVRFKCENFQKAGAFKYRGATHALLQLGPEVLTRGAATHSSGNHAQALALAAQVHGTRAYIVMPKNAPAVKKQAVLGYGAEVTECAPTLAAREETLAALVEKTGAAFVHPYNDWSIIAGQATAAKELLEDEAGLDVILAPVGGGGLLSGTALAARYFSPATTVIGAEPEGADDAFRSLQSGTIQPSVHPQTIADGLLTSLGDKTFSVIREYVQGIVTVSDKEIIEAMRLIWERMKIIAEPSAAVPLAALLKEKKSFQGKKVGIILSGGNVGLEQLPF